MSTRNEPRALHDKVAWIEEQLRKLHGRTSSLPSGLFVLGGGGSGGSGVDHDTLSNVTEDQHHARQHTMADTDDHIGAISASQHPVILSGNHHPEYAGGGSFARNWMGY